jgi:3-dehydroquinate synthase
VETVTIRAGGGVYQVLVGAGLLRLLGEKLQPLVRGRRCAVVADENTAPRFAGTISGSLAAAGFAPVVITVPAGEDAKSLVWAGELCERFAQERLDRSSFVVAVGGGVVGDLAGFAAAIYHRGIAQVQVPTTLLAQVDSSIGGKTAVNSSAGKNLLGAVHQPVLVVSDVETLRTLPEREFRQGMAEVIKHGVIADPSLLQSSSHTDLVELVCRNVRIKAAVVQQDEQDLSGTRAVLNFGHTVGHAIERAGDYRLLLHGEAVSLGIVAACAVSVRCAGFKEEERQQVITALAAAGLPTRLPNELPRDAILPALLHDKKFENGQVRFVVTSRLGEAHLTSEVTLDDIAAAIEQL